MNLIRLTPWIIFGLKKRGTCTQILSGNKEMLEAETFRGKVKDASFCVGGRLPQFRPNLWSCIRQLSPSTFVVRVVERVCDASNTHRIGRVQRGCLRYVTVRATQKNFWTGLSRHRVLYIKTTRRISVFH
jgi:hypothetical protein